MNRSNPIKRLQTSPASTPAGASWHRMSSLEGSVQMLGTWLPKRTFWHLALQTARSLRDQSLPAQGISALFRLHGSLPTHCPTERAKKAVRPRMCRKRPVASVPHRQIARLGHQLPRGASLACMNLVAVALKHLVASHSQHIREGLEQPG